MNPDDQALLTHLREMWEVTDPPPSDLVTRTMFLLELEDLEFELMSLAPEPSGAGARAPETASTITFAAESLTVMITVSPTDTPHAAGPPGQRFQRLDGWIAPSASLRVELRTTVGVQEGVADQDGRFVFAEVPCGLIQLVVHPTDGAAVRLVRPVVTPATKL